MNCGYILDIDSVQTKLSQGAGQGPKATGHSAFLLSVGLAEVPLLAETFPLPQYGWQKGHAATRIWQRLQASPSCCVYPVVM